MKILGVTLGVRDFKISQFWRDKIKTIDRLEVVGYDHDQAHKICRTFFIEHPEYTHLLFIAEDVLVTPDMIDLLIDDQKTTDYKVISGYLNIAFTSDLMSLSTTDLTKHPIRTTNDYHFHTLKQCLNNQSLNPIIPVFFQGLGLTIIDRSVIEKTTFKPYTKIYEWTRFKQFGMKIPNFGVMFDLQFALELSKLGILQFVDLRLLMLHFGVTIDMIKLQGKPRTVTFIDQDGNRKLVREEKPYF